VSRCLDADLRIGNAESIRQLFSQVRNLWPQLRGFRDHCCIDIHDPRFFVGKNLTDPFQNLDATNSADGFIRVWKMLADVSGADRSEQRVGDRVRKNIRVGMSFESEQVRNFYPAQNQFPILPEAMNVVADTATRRAHNFKSITPLDATMLYLSFISLWGCK